MARRADTGSKKESTTVTNTPLHCRIQNLIGWAGRHTVAVKAEHGLTAIRTTFAPTRARARTAKCALWITRLTLISGRTVVAHQVIALTFPNSVGFFISRTFFQADIVTRLEVSTLKTTRGPSTSAATQTFFITELASIIAIKIGP